MPRSSVKSSVAPVSRPTVPFLLSQVGAHAAGSFADRIAPLGCKPYHVGILSVLDKQPGLTQQGLADVLGMFPSRLVGLLDELGKAKLIERRESPEDRRIHAVHLTKAGRETVAKAWKIAWKLEEDLCAGLEAKELEQLADLLGRIVTQQKITPGVHPGYRRMNAGCGEEEPAKRKG